MGGVLYSSVERHIGGGISGVFGPRYIKEVERVILYIDANNFHVWSMIQAFPHVVLKM